MVFCEGTTTNLSFFVNPPSALSLLSFDTVTNTAFGPSNTHASVTVNGTNLTVNGFAAGAAYVRGILGNTTFIGPTLTIVRVTFPPEGVVRGCWQSDHHPGDDYPGQRPGHP